MTWRDHYLELLAEGEARNLKAGALGRYIADRLTNGELIDLENAYFHAREALLTLDGKTPTRKAHK